MRIRQMTMQDILATLRVAWDSRTDDTDRRRFSPDAFWISGLETLAPGDRYHWDGLRRGGDPPRPVGHSQLSSPAPTGTPCPRTPPRDGPSSG